MHPVLARQLGHVSLATDSIPPDAAAWASFLGAVGSSYEQADQDRYLLERSLSLSSAEMGELHAQLAAEKDSIDTVICSLVEGVCAIDNDGVILLINPTARKILHLDQDEPCVGRRLGDLVKARTPKGGCLEDVLTLAEDTGPVAGAEPRIIIADDRDTYVTFTVSPLGQNGAGLVLTLRDVTEKTRLEKERNELNRRLIDLSRQAGMAEVASDVLHNVGNVLNSVNVSASIAHDTIKASKVVAVSKIATLLGENQHRLADFLAEDPTGSRIPEYLGQLGEHLTTEHERVLDELTALRKSVDHIREIVAAQQSYAKVRGLREFEDMAAITNEAIRVVEASLTRHGIEIIRDFQPTDQVLVERNQILQVLVNLLTNAKQAIIDQEHGPRTITLRIEPVEDATEVRVIDSGCGIAPENLSRIFAHGFTTRPSGHGFGLHSAAVSAQAMGGTLVASSNGIGLGSCFTFRVLNKSAHTERAA